jgi:kynurenine formamidase
MAKRPGVFSIRPTPIQPPEHGGTHLDAPIHFATGKWTVDELPLSSLTGNAVVIDVSEGLAKKEQVI